MTQALFKEEDAGELSPTEKLRARLREIYKEDLLLEEFSSFRENGYNYKHADAVAISCHPARTDEVEYFEIKVSRSDWLKEVDNPSKSIVAEHCDRVWLLTPEAEGIALLEEIPKNWGWMYLKGKRFKVLKEAPKLQPNFDRNFIIRMAQYTKREFNKAIMDAEQKAYDKARITAEQRFDEHYWKQESDRNAKHVEEWEQKMKTLTDALGVSNDYYMGLDYKKPEELKEIGKILYWIYSLKEKKTESWELQHFERELKNIEEQVVMARSAVKRLRLSEVDLGVKIAKPPDDNKVD